MVVLGDETLRTTARELAETVKRGGHDRLDPEGASAPACA